MTRARTSLQVVFRRPVSYARTLTLVLVLMLAGASAAIYAPAAIARTWPAATQASAAAIGEPDATTALWPVLPTCAESTTQVDTDLFIRTELFFGSLKPDGTEVTAAEFDRFLDEEITPRFPEGLTLLTGYGQFRNAQGTIVQENSRLLILLYPLEFRKDSSDKIEQIRELYNQRFQQESVLRSDDPLPVCVSF